MMRIKEIAIKVKQAQQGNKEAYGELIKEFQATVYSIAFSRSRSPIDAQDITQEIFLYVMAKIQNLKDARCFPAWLKQIAIRKAINLSIKNKRKPVSIEEESLVDRHKQPLDILIESERRELLHDNIHKLKKLYADSIIRFYFKKSPIKQIAKDLNKPVGTIKRRLHMAKIKLKQAIGN